MPRFGPATASDDPCYDTFVLSWRRPNTHLNFLSLFFLQMVCHDCRITGLYCRRLLQKWIGGKQYPVVPGELYYMAIRSEEKLTELMEWQVLDGLPVKHLASHDGTHHNRRATRA